MAVVLCYVDKKGIVTERFLSIIHVANTSTLSLNAAIKFLFCKYALSLSRLRGQGYDRASNMQGEFNGLKTLILKENKSAFYVHYFAHQLQLTLVAIANKHTNIAEFFSLVSKIVTIVGASCKRQEFLRNAQLAKITEALNMGELESGQGLNQETSLKRASDTRWGSHYRTILNLILMFSSIVDVLEMIEKDSLLSEERVKAQPILSKHEIPILNMYEIFVVGVRPRRNATQITNLQHYHVDLLVIDLQLQELNNCFLEVTTELLLCMACLNSSDSFLAFDINKLTHLTKFYSSDFSQTDVLALNNQLQTCIVDIHSNDEFLELKGIGDLARKMVWRQIRMLYVHWYICL
nr:zinc finger MYM-type protein 1-like [Quercus suber]